MSVVGIGFFRELEHGTMDGPSLREAVGVLDRDPVPVAAYLRAGSRLAAAASIALDELDERHPEIGSLEILTDGHWYWASDLAYYVEQYRVGLPEGFLAFGDARGWKAPPRLSDDELMAIDGAM